MDRIGAQDLSVPVSEVLSPKLWRERFAFGLVMGQPDPKGSTIQERIAKAIASPKECPDVVAELRGIPDQTILWHLRSALSELELKLGLTFGVRIVKGDPVDAGLVAGVDYDAVEPRRPYTRSDARNWYRIDLPQPVLSIQRVRAYYFGTQIWNIGPEAENTELIRVTHPNQGTVHVLPTNMSALLVSQSGGYGIGAFSLVALHHAPVPDFWSVDYTTGTRTKAGEVGRIEAVLAQWCYAVAAMTLFAIAGAAKQRGIASTSLSLDGVSRSVSLQGSGAIGLYGAVEKTFSDLTERIDWKALRSAKRGIGRVRPYGH